MIQRNNLAALLFALLLPGPPGLAEENSKPPLYFPPRSGVWETVNPASVRWDKALLDDTLDYAERNGTSGIVILLDGKILAERHVKIDWPSAKDAGQPGFSSNAAGHAIEDVASVQKSISSVLVGIAQQKGLLDLNDPVHQYLGRRWSKATPRQERSITIRHLLTMTSGLDERGRYEADAGTKWKYNTPVYSKTMDVVAAAAKLDRQQLTRKWLTEPLGMDDSEWIDRESPAVVRVNRFGFATTARDLARFGLMMLAGGKWGEQAILADAQFLQQATTASQDLNPFYGYLWWLNDDAGETGKKRQEPRFPAAPKDLFAAKGALKRSCFVAPSMRLVVTRLGKQPSDGRRFDNLLWQKLMAAAPGPADPE